MIILSSLRHALRVPTATIKNEAIKRCMSGDGHKTFTLVPSRWQWVKFKDYFHYYVMLGAIPCTLGIFLANVFVGPATLSEIPEDYVPKHWEYYRNPVTRFIARYISPNPQQEYEKYLCYIYMEDELRKLRMLEKEIKQKMAERNDYQAYYYRPVTGKYHRISREAADYLDTIRGE